MFKEDYLLPVSLYLLFPGEYLYFILMTELGAESWFPAENPIFAFHNIFCNFAHSNESPALIIYLMWTKHVLKKAPYIKSFLMLFLQILNSLTFFLFPSGFLLFHFLCIINRRSSPLLSFILLSTSNCIDTLTAPYHLDY